jgi:hypothetical protein
MQAQIEISSGYRLRCSKPVANHAAIIYEREFIRNQMKICANRRRVHLEYREKRGNGTAGRQGSVARYGIKPVSHLCDQRSFVDPLSSEPIISGGTLSLNASSRSSYVTCCSGNRSRPDARYRLVIWSLPSKQQAEESRRTRPLNTAPALDVIYTVPFLALRVD